MSQTKKIFAAVVLSIFLPLLASGAPTNYSDSIKPFPKGKFVLQTNDVIAFLGGADVAAAQETGHLETLLTAAHPGFNLRFRNFAWEGDTVFTQPREIGFPSLTNLLQQERVSVIFLQFGRMEALSTNGSEAFGAAYEKLLQNCMQHTPRLVLVKPPPFERALTPLPDLRTRHLDLLEIAGKVEALALSYKLPFVDLMGLAPNHRSPRPRDPDEVLPLYLTHDGVQLTPLGHAVTTKIFARSLGFAKTAAVAGSPRGDGSWPNPAFERLRQSVVKKNKLWFNYWRPQNWAFLGGDRTEQLSSRDHRDHNIRWFPKEMEKFLPLIEAQEKEIAELAAALQK